MPPTSNEPLLEIIDDFAPAELFAEASKLSAAKGWYYGHGSHEGDWGRFWKMDLEGIKVFDALWERTRERCEEITGSPLLVIRQYANGHTYGLGGRTHVDDHRPGSYTLLYYPMTEWLEEWEGETVFYDSQGEVAVTVRPRPNRAVLFDSRIPHAGRAPGRMCPELRVTVAYKLESASALEALEEPEHATVAIESEPELKYTVRTPETVVRAKVAEKLAKLGETLRLPGFRAGKVPMALLEQRYGENARVGVVKTLAEEVAAKAPKGTIVTNIDVQQEEENVAFHVSAIHLPALPEPDTSSLVIERLTASEDDLLGAGLTREDLASHVSRQILDFLDSSYLFDLPVGAVDREFVGMWEQAKSHGAASDEDAQEFRSLAERRVRLGIVVAELARRWSMSGTGLDGQVIARLLAKADVRERAATQEELAELAG